MYVCVCPCTCLHLFFVLYVVGCVWQPQINEHDDDDEQSMAAIGYSTSRMVLINATRPTVGYINFSCRQLYSADVSTTCTQKPNCQGKYNANGGRRICVASQQIYWKININVRGANRRQQLRQPCELCQGLGVSYCGPAAWNTLLSDLHDIRDTDTFRKRLKSVLFEKVPEVFLLLTLETRLHPHHWLLLALLDVSYSGALQILRWLIDWLTGTLTSQSWPEYVTHVYTGLC